jgi:hypothetical protein
LFLFNVVFWIWLLNSVTPPHFHQSWSSSHVTTCSPYAWYIMTHHYQS